MSPRIPRLEDHLPDFTAFLRRLSEDFEAGEFTEWNEIDSRVRGFFSATASAEMEATIPGWRRMAGNRDGLTQTHTVCVLIALYGLPEYQTASSGMKDEYEWVALLHDIAKKPPATGFQEQTHAFTSAASAAPVLADLGFPTRPDYAAVVADWQSRTRAASLRRDDMDFPDNTKLPGIVTGIDRMFGAGSTAARILRTILLHLSFSWIGDWPAAAPLSEEEVAAFLDPQLLDSLVVLAQMDSNAWTMFDAATRERYRCELMEFKAATSRVIAATE